MARQRDNTKLLAKFSTEELQAEVARRLNQETGKQWGYLVVEDSDGEAADDPRFGILTIDEWKQNRHISDHCVSGMVNLPEGFEEIQESIFEFREGDVAYARELLDKFGFVFLGAIDI